MSSSMVRPFTLVVTVSTSNVCGRWDFVETRVNVAREIIFALPAQKEVTLRTPFSNFLSWDHELPHIHLRTTVPL